MDADALDWVTMIATVVAAVFFGWQLWLIRKDAQASLEDELSREYRAIIQSLGVKAFYRDG